MTTDREGTQESPDIRAFKDCDVRGVYPDELDEDLFQRVGRAFGRQVASSAAPGLQAGLVVVGGDARLSTPGLRRAFLNGLSRHALTVLDLGGAVPTPVVYWAKSVRKAQASAIVTASHNPPSWNGLKVMNGALPPTPEDILALADGAGETAGISAPCTVEPWPGVVDAYLDELRGLFAGGGVKGLTIAVDPGNGCFSGIASRLFRELGASVVALHDTVDGLFRERHPDCAVPSHLQALQAAAAEHTVNFGVAFDGDGDRIAVVDGKGRVLGAERLAMVLFQGPLRPKAGEHVILDVKCSMHLDRLIKSLGGEPVRCKSGHAFMKRTVLEHQALAGVELSGHVFLGRIDARDDPLHIALLLADWLGREKRILSDIVDALTPMYMTEDMRIALPAAEIERIITVCGEGLGGGVPEHLDGVRLVWPDGWLLARRSITEPKITMRMEGETPESLKRIGTLFGKAFPDLEKVVSESVSKVPGVA